MKSITRFRKAQAIIATVIAGAVALNVAVLITLEWFVAGVDDEKRGTDAVPNLHYVRAQMDRTKAN